MNNDEIVYVLTIEDIQTVANEQLGRDLVQEEIEKIKDSIAENISWYDAITQAIYQNIDEDPISKDWESLLPD